MRAFLAIKDGKFEVTDLNKSLDAVVLVSADPQEVFDFIDSNGVYGFSHSSSVDFPQDYGMDPAKVEELDDLIEDARVRRDPVGKLRDIANYLEQIDDNSYSPLIMKRHLLAIVNRR